MRTIIFLFMASTAGFAQVTGKVQSASNPVPFANVVILRNDSSLLSGSVTTEGGTFFIDVKEIGTFILRVSAVGYKTYNRTGISLTSGIYDTGTIHISEDATELNEVVVKAEKPLLEQHADKTIVNVEASIMTKGSSVLQLLERSPGVFVDQRNGSIAMNGKSGVMVMMNGKLMRLPMAQLVAMLNSLSANDIESIELLPMPPASMDADGNAGVINIVTKLNKEDGTRGSFAAYGGHGYGPKGGASLNLQHIQGPLRLYSSYSFMHDRNLSGWEADGSQVMPAFGGYVEADVVDTEIFNTNSHNATGGVDYRLKGWSLGGNASYTSSSSAREISNEANYNLIDADSFLLMRSSIAGTNRWRNLTGGVYASKELKDGSKISFDYDYLNYLNNNPTEINSVFLNDSGAEVTPSGTIFFNRLAGRGRTPIHVNVVKSDYQKKLSEKLRMEAGVKATFTGSNNSSAIERFVNDRWTIDERSATDVRMKEKILASYASFAIDLSETTKLTAGARYEYSRTQTESPKPENEIDWKVSRLFPNVLISKSFGQNTRLQLNWSTRITRPSYNELASFVQYTDPMSAMTGNPLLKPTITNNISLGASISGYSFTLLASQDENPIIRWQLTENSTHDLMYCGPQNMPYQNSLMFTTSLPFRVTKWWNMTLGTTSGIRQFEVTHTRMPAEKTYFFYVLNGTQTFSLPKNFSFELSGWYNSSQYDGSKHVTGFGALNAGVKKDFGKRGSLQLALSDVLMSLKLVNKFGELTEEAFNVQSHAPWRSESSRFRVFRITYSITFGGEGSVSSRDASDSERSRLK
ncbi:MAG TPA: outer membrane beta-barrel protein [Cyclobacteriaceae bacterium]|nr:outer membrane beta-barrel protein [Cyclobacteriaceae bacterium]